MYNILNLIEAYLFIFVYFNYIYTENNNSIASIFSQLI